MFVYEKRLQYPIRIKNTNPRLAKIIISQYGGPHGEIGASLRYLSQRYAMPIPELKAILTDIGTEELSHLEMVGTIVYQLTRNMTPEQIKAAGFDDYFVDHTAGVYPVAASGTPFNAATFSVTGHRRPPRGYERRWCVRLRTTFQKNVIGQAVTTTIFPVYERRFLPG